MKRIFRLIYNSYHVPFLSVLNFLSVRILTLTMHMENGLLRLALISFGYSCTLVIVLINLYFVMYCSESFKPTTKLIYRIIKRDFLRIIYSWKKQMSCKKFLYILFTFIIFISFFFVPVNESILYIYIFYFLFAFETYLIILHFLWSGIRPQHYQNIIRGIIMYFPFCIPYLFEAYVIHNNIPIRFYTLTICMYMYTNTFIALRLGTRRDEGHKGDTGDTRVDTRGRFS